MFVSHIETNNMSISEILLLVFVCIVLGYFLGAFSMWLYKEDQLDFQKKYIEEKYSHLKSMMEALGKEDDSK